MASARLGALEDRLDALLRLGRHREALDESRDLVAGNPLRERLAGQLMTALCRDGRAAEALDEFRRYRQRLADDLGLDAGPALRDLDFDTAVTTAEQAPAVARQTRLRLLEGHALVVLASISLDRGRRADARAHAAAALAVHRETGHVLGRSRAARLLELLGEGQRWRPGRACGWSGLLSGR